LVKHFLCGGRSTWQLPNAWSCAFNADGSSARHQKVISTACTGHEFRKSPSLALGAGETISFLLT
jgi:hypothetical protein